MIPSSSIAFLRSLAAPRTASPVISVWREPDVVPESGAFSVLATATLILVTGKVAACAANVFAIWQRTAAERFTAFQKFIPWIAFLLLLYIGGSMLLEGLRKNDPDAASGVKELTIGALLMQGVATSIDALSVGFTIESYGVAAAFSAALIIAVVTFIICVCGLVLGRAVGMRYARHASILGGVILIGIGLEILIEHLFF